MNIIAAITILATYAVTVCVATGKIPASLSQTVFSLPRNGRWLWSVVIAALAFLTMPTLIQESCEATKFLGFLACGSLMFVGVCPLVQQEGEISYIIHIIMAYTCAICSQLLVLMNNPLLLLGWLPWIIVFAGLILKEKKWKTQAFWAEMTCFVITFLYGFKYYWSY
jgi:hypothetical protein